MSKRIAAQLEKLRGDEWDSDSDNEEQPQVAKAGKGKAAKVKAAAGSETDAAAPFSGQEEFVQLDAPKLSKKQRKAAAAAVQRAADAGAASGLSNVIYLGRIPHGFYEKQMMGFFKQFGVVRRLRLSRNKRSGNSKHYAFIQFDEVEVAQVVANTMNEYRLFDHTLSCHLVPAHAVHERMFLGANKAFKPQPWKAIARKQHNAERTYEQTVALNKKLLRVEKVKRKQLSAIGVEYEFPGYAGQRPSKKQHISFE